jgi:probable F420-dependent oxidoreductase
MKVLTSIPAHDLHAVGPAAAAVEARGFAGVSTQENRHDPFLPLAVAATHTTTLELRTSVAIAFARSPMSTANLAWDLQNASGGRFTLGLGSQVKGHNVRRFSVPWSPPAPRLREYVQALRAIWDCWQNGTRLDYQGRHYQFTLMTPNFTPEPLSCAPPRVAIAAVGPAMLKVAAQECDGAMLHAFCTRKYLDEVVGPGLRAGLRESGRERSAFEISGGGFVATGANDAAVQEVFEWVRTRIGFYGSTPAYWPVLQVHGLEELGHKLNDMSKQGRWAQMTREISDDVVHLFAAVGRFDEIAVAIERRFGGAADVVALPDTAPPELLQDVARIPVGRWGAL